MEKRVQPRSPKAGSQKKALSARPSPIAAERRTSVSKLVREALQELAAEETVFERALSEERKLVEGLRKRSRSFKASGRLTRDEVHTRDALC